MYVFLWRTPHSTAIGCKVCSVPQGRKPLLENLMVIVCTAIKRKGYTNTRMVTERGGKLVAYIPIFWAVTRGDYYNNYCQRYSAFVYFDYFSCSNESVSSNVNVTSLKIQIENLFDKVKSSRSAWPHRNNGHLQRAKDWQLAIQRHTTPSCTHQPMRTWAEALFCKICCCSCRVGHGGHTG